MGQLNQLNDRHGQNAEADRKHVRSAVDRLEACQEWHARQVVDHRLKNKQISQFTLCTLSMD